MSPARTHTKGLPTSKEILFMWQEWTFCKRLLVGKWQKSASKGAETPKEPISPPSVVSVVVAAVKSNAATTRGIVENTEVYINDGSSVSLIQESVLKDLATKNELPPTGITLVSAAGEDTYPSIRMCCGHIKCSNIQCWDSYFKKVTIVTSSSLFYPM